MRDTWWRSIAAKLQPFSDTKDNKKFNDAMKAVYGPQSGGSTPLLSCDKSTPLTVTDYEQMFQEGMTARVLDDGTLSDPFPVTNGVKQDCALAPTLFIIIFSAMLNKAFKDLDFGVDIRFRTDG
ncbi:hypothetical protein HOLleu_11798 [Holothuria leucospilota]|uniref:Reverse transcriptase domain-containing protein n=1 Tax=Holothuria leucospilota TaxID=206669 RepID=A0A9Q1HDA1_HOLLE|nr:hypothetical protein HOLleu_11798 [Holothuria leucospilota]